MGSNTTDGSMSDIDRLRTSAGSFDISTPGDDTEVTTMITIGNDHLYIVKGGGIYEVRLADQIDPERTNIGIPNTIQRVLPYGSDHPWVRSVFLTAHQLFNKDLIEEEIDCEKAMKAALSMARDLAAAVTAAEEYIQKEKDELERFENKIKSDRSIVLPSIEDSFSSCKEFLQKLDHTVRELFEIVKLFNICASAGGWDTLKASVELEDPKADNFVEFLEYALPTLHFVRNARNCIEHPREGHRLDVSNFSIDTNGHLVPPRISVVHSKSSLDTTLLPDFLSGLFHEIVGIAELMLVYICSRRVRSISGFRVQVYELPESHQQARHVKFGYGILNGEDVVPFG